jgi:FkbM family methyltransferase
MIKFLQIGAHIGQNDLASSIIKNSNIEFGLLIEPLPHLIPHLVESYKDFSNIIIENKAVTINTNEKLKFFYDKVDPITELSSFSREHLINHNILDENIAEIIVDGETFDSILERHSINELDWLFIDTEGYDCDILLSIDFSKYKIDSIVFEYTHSDGVFSRGGEKLNKVIEKLTSFNYDINPLDFGNLKCKLKTI